MSCFYAGDEIASIHTRPWLDGLIVLYLDQENDLAYLIDGNGRISAIDICELNQLDKTGRKFKLEVKEDRESTPIDIESDEFYRKAKVDILKDEIKKINYELDRICKELHELTKVNKMNGRK